MIIRIRQRRRRIEKNDYSNLISAIKVPILIIHGKKDKDVPMIFSQKLAEKFKNIRLKEVKNGDHDLKVFYQKRNY